MTTGVFSIAAQLPRARKSSPTRRRAFSFFSPDEMSINGFSFFAHNPDGIAAFLCTDQTMGFCIAASECFNGAMNNSVLLQPCNGRVKV
jgi:hypothetical protein